MIRTANYPVLPYTVPEHLKNIAPIYNKVISLSQSDFASALRVLLTSILGSDMI